MLNAPLILASGSPRRRALLDQLNIAFRVVAADIDESPRSGELPGDYARRIALEKAEAVHARENARQAVLAADTIVVLDGELFGKPRDERHAFEMLRQLSARTHEVISAVALLMPEGSRRSAQSVSRVRFAPLEDAWIEAYCATGEPLDKAGAYGVQGLAAARIEHLEGSFSGVMGLPLYETGELLRAAGWTLLPECGRP